MKTDRPVHLNLFQISFPLAAIVSITHRITGVVLFAGMALALYALDLALTSEAGYLAAGELLAAPLPKLVMLALLFTLTFHITAGVKHLLLDFHVGDSIAASRNGAAVVIVVSVIVTALLGVSLW